jgi:hypothetical protein
MAFRIEMLPPPEGFMPPIPPAPAHWLGTSPGDVLVATAAAEDAKKGGDGMYALLFIGFFVFVGLMFASGDKNSQSASSPKSDGVPFPNGTKGLFGLGCGSCTGE